MCKIYRFSAIFIVKIFSLQNTQKSKRSKIFIQVKRDFDRKKKNKLKLVMKRYLNKKSEYGFSFSLKIALTLNE